MPGSTALPFRRLSGHFSASSTVASPSAHLFGMAPSMLKQPPLLDRSKLQCLDLSLANGSGGCKYGYKGVEGGFHFGSRHYSASENAGFFLFEDARVLSLLKDGSVVGEWDRFSTFLRDELTAAETLGQSTIPVEWWH